MDASVEKQLDIKTSTDYNINNLNVHVIIYKIFISLKNGILAKSYVQLNHFIHYYN